MQNQGLTAIVAELRLSGAEGLTVRPRMANVTASFPFNFVRFDELARQD